MYLDIFFKELDLSDHTKRAYERAIKQMISFIDKPLEEIDSLDIAKWKQSLSDLSIANQCQKISAIKSYFRFLREFKVKVDDPSEVIRLPRETAIQRRTRIEKKYYIPSEDIIKLINCTNNPREKAIIAIFLNTGLRAQEVIDIQLKDYLDLIKHDKPIFVPTKGNKYRQIKLNQSTITLINNYLKVRKNGITNLFVSNQGTPMNQACLNRTLKKLAKKAKVSTDITNHWIRGTKATEVYKKHGITNAKELLGHQSEITTRIYLKDMQKDINAIMEEDFKGVI